MKLTVDTLKAAFDNDLEITLAVSESLLTSRNELHSRLQAALSQQNGLEIKAAIHAIKGAVSVFGESDFYIKIKLIDQNLKHQPDFKDDSSVQGVLGEFSAFVDSVQEAVMSYRRGAL